MASPSCLYAFLLLLALQSTMIKATIVLPSSRCKPITASTLAKIEFSLNLLILKSEFYLRASMGLGIDDISPGLVKGPVPIGITKANLDNDTRKVIEELGLTAVGHIRAIMKTTALKPPIPMAQMDLSPRVYGIFLNKIFNTSHPSFNVYGNTNSFLLAANYFAYYLPQYYAEIIPSIVGNDEKELVGEIALNEAAGFGVIRSKLYDRVNLTVSPFTFTVGDFISGGAKLGNQLGCCGVKDEGLIVPLKLGAENRTTTNVLPADVDSLTYPRSEREIIRIVFTTGDATKPGGIFPHGFKGALYQLILKLKLN